MLNSLVNNVSKSFIFQIRNFNANIDQFFLVLLWLQSGTSACSCYIQSMTHVTRLERDRGRGDGVSVFNRVELFIDEVEYLGICRKQWAVCRQRGTRYCFFFYVYCPHADMIDNICFQIEGMLGQDVLANLKIVAALDLDINLFSLTCIHGTNFLDYMK